MSGGWLVGWWQGLAARERAVLAFGAVVVAAVAVYLLLWEPPAQGIRKLRADLPALRAQDAAMRAMADEAGRLRAAGGTAATIAPSDRIAAVRRSLQRAGLWREGASASPAATAARAGDAGVGSTVSTLSVGGTVTTVASAATLRSDPPEVVAEANNRVRVRFDNIDYGVWIAWLASTETELATHAARVSVNSLAPKAPVGHVRAEVVLDWSQPGPAAGAGPASSS